MFQKRLKKELNKIEVPAYDTHKYKETIAKAKKITLHPENLRMSSTEFFCDQLRFIKTETWFLKIIVSALVLYLLITEQINISSWFWTLIAISGPCRICSTTRRPRAVCSLPVTRPTRTRCSPRSRMRSPARSAWARCSPTRAAQEFI